LLEEEQTGFFLLFSPAPSIYELRLIARERRKVLVAPETLRPFAIILSAEYATGDSSLALRQYWQLRKFIGVGADE
jgi:hypothetical protein